MLILMKPNKELVISSPSKIYQRESAVDKLIFLVPQMYKEIDLSPFTVALEYVDTQNVAHSELLVLDEELYKDLYLRYTVPITSEITKFCGDITLKLTMDWVDAETLQQYTLHTGEIQIEISPLSDYYTLVSDESLEAIDQALLRVNAQVGALEKLAEKIDSEQVDDLYLTDENMLHVSVNGTPIGDGVEISVNPQDTDGELDGIIDLSTATGSGLEPPTEIPIIDL